MMTEIEQLRAEVASLKEQLQPYLERDAEEERVAAWNDRLHLLVDLCCPNYDSRRRETGPIRHPETSWWWNGASIQDYTQLVNGDVQVDLKSYVAGGNYDEKSITLLAEWFKLDDPKEAVQLWCVEETKRRDDIQKRNDRERKLAEIERLQRSL